VVVPVLYYMIVGEERKLHLCPAVPIDAKKEEC
jgi:hypothetical protein